MRKGSQVPLIHDFVTALESCHYVETRESFGAVQIVTNYYILMEMSESSLVADYGVRSSLEGLERNVVDCNTLVVHGALEGYFLERNVADCDTLVACSSLEGHFLERDAVD